MKSDPFGSLVNPLAHMPRQKRAAANKFFALDFDAMKVETDVPLVERAPSGGKWEPLVSKLTKKGQSIAFPIEFKQAVAAYCLNKKRKTGADLFRVANETAKTARIWRIE